MALNFDSVLPEGVSLYDFQTVGVAYALTTRRCFIADEMGLGKTIQALTVLALTKSFPAVIVCPATLKGNWKKEVVRALPGRTVEVLGGKTPYPVEAEIVIVNYDILAAWEASLAPAALVLDESHYAKNPKAARTQSAQRLAARVPAEGVVLLLTGTPLLNRPIELLSQLQVLGKLEDVAPVWPAKNGQAPAPADFRFKYSYCRNQESFDNTGKWTWDSAVNTGELNDRLRASCYVRRLRKAALGMNDTRRQTVALSLNGALKRYRAAEKDIIAFIKAEAGDAAARKAKQAEALVRLGKLRKLIGEAKVEATAEYIQNWLESNPERSLVVFAWFKETQAKLIEALADYSPSQILASQKDVDAQKERFQDGTTRVILCSILAAKEGHTLTAASDVLFAEQGWNPGTMQQAEDRINRIGQTADQCFSWTMLAEDTIDEFVANLIEAKRATFKAVADGGDLAGDDTEITAAVLDYLRQKGEGA